MLALLVLIGALILGYGFKSFPINHQKLELIIFIITIILLLCIGYYFGSNNQIFVIIDDVLDEVTYLTLLLFITTVLFTYLFVKIFKLSVEIPTKNTTKSIPFIKYLKNLQYIIYVSIGFYIGHLVDIQYYHISIIINSLLVIILFIVGHQLRVANLKLQHIFFNKIGLIIVLISVISSIVDGFIVYMITNSSLRESMVVFFGFAWYTLSGVLATDLFNSKVGLTIFFVDLLREIIPMCLLPLLVRFQGRMSIVFFASTALDYGLPVIKDNLGYTVVPIAITSGMMLSILSPISISLIHYL
jgi:uncharacterized membrane protein YbjE (DUF340 family)